MTPTRAVCNALNPAAMVMPIAGGASVTPQSPELQQCHHGDGNLIHAEVLLVCEICWAHPHVKQGRLCQSPNNEPKINMRMYGGHGSRWISKCLPIFTELRPSVSHTGSHWVCLVDAAFLWTFPANTQQYRYGHTRNINVSWNFPSIWSKGANRIHASTCDVRSVQINID